jgi:hypothetical protein
MLLFLETPPLRRWFPEWERFWRNKNFVKRQLLQFAFMAVASDSPLKIWLAIE